MSDPRRLTESKFLPPRPHVALVTRKALLAALRRVQAPLVLVSAPAGAGKTTLLGQWAEENGPATAWLKLDEGDNDPVVLLTYLATALASVLGLDQRFLDSLRRAVVPAPETIVSALVLSISAAKPFLLLIDDAQYLVNGQCWKLLQGLFAASSPGAHVGIATRTEPPLRMARLHAAGEVLEIGGDALALDRDEIRELFELHGITADDRAVDALLETTEGWATGVYLSALCEKLDGTCTPPSEARGDRREVARYLTSEVLERQPKDVRRFPLSTSILDRLNPSLCAAVSGRHDANDLLLRLVQDNIFISGLGGRECFYRYHPLFADFLQAELASRAPLLVPKLHRRAAAWYCKDGDVDRAVRHWLAAGDVACAGDLVAANWMPSILRGRVATVDAWLRQFSDEQAVSHPPLTLAVGWFHAINGDERTGALWRRADAGGGVDGPSPDGAASLRSSRAMLRSMLAVGGVVEMRREAEIAAELETRPGNSWNAVANLLLGRALIATGETRRAVGPLRVAVDGGARYFVPMELSALGYLALLAADEQDWDEAATCAERATACMTTLGWGEASRSAHLHVAWARVRAQNGAHGVIDQLDLARRALETMDTLPFSALQVSVLAGEICLREGRTDVAERWMARAKATLGHWPDAGVFVARARRLRAALDRAHGVEPLSAAEGRVLTFLPTQLTLQEIAERLCVTRNTVKTHMEHIRIKLSAKKRSEIVERARELGWLSR
jgi:LuxR family transcriptional regulator, maltose regulon positive regulatory protein